jgi:glycosyltransferase involved in cell wall biosynthesis
MKILELTTSFPNFKGDNNSVFIYQKVKAVVETGNQNDVIVPHDYNTRTADCFDGITIKRFTYFFHKKFHRLTYNYGVPENVKRFFLAKIQIPFLIILFFLKTFFVGRHYDVIHANWSLAGMGGVLAAKLLRKPFVLTIHGAEIFKLKRNRIISLLIMLSPNIVVNSNFTLEQVKQYYSIKNKNVAVLPFGVEKLSGISKYQDPNIWNKKFNIDKKKKVIFSLGRLVERKGHRFLIEAFKIIEEKSNEFALVIGGHGPEEESLLKLAKELDLESIWFTKNIDENELHLFFANAFCFVLPAIIDSDGDTEGLGVVNIEALAHGVPVVSTNVGGIPDVIINKKTGLVVNEKSSEELASAILELNVDNDLRAQLIKGGLEHVEKHFSWKSIAKKYVNFYKKII